MCNRLASLAGRMKCFCNVYALKFGDLTPEQNLDAYEALRGKRLVVSAGLFWGLEVPEDLTDDPLEDLPYFDMLYKFVAGSGYNLTTKSPLIRGFFFA